MKKILIAVLFFTIPLFVISQAVITFEKKTHDFGTIKEEDGRVNYDFVFKNEGNVPLVISNVKASCGCTSKEWTKSPIEPGKEGTITVSYNPTGRPGGFNKYVTVQSNATVQSEKLYIKGEVVQKSKEYPIDINGLLISTNIIQFNNIEKGTIKEQKIKLSNNTNESINISFVGLPKHITISPSSNTTLVAKSEGIINFIFDSKKCSEWGPITNNFHLIINENKEVSSKNRLTIKTNIVDDFSNMSIAEKRSAPIMEIQKRTISLGTLNQGEKRTSSFNVKNVGERTLSIRKIVNNNNGIVFDTEQLSIRSGKLAEIKFTVNTTGLKQGKYNRTITLQTNDPENAFIILSIEWEIK